jgi:hypothetical protein
MTQVPQVAESPPKGVRTAARIASIVAAIVGVLMFLTIPMPWVEESYVISHGPLIGILVGVLAVVAGTLMGNDGPRVRSTERAATRQRVDALKAQGYSVREATRLGRPTYTLRRRAGRLFGGGVLAVASGVVELAAISYNMDEIDRLGLTPAFGATLATFASWALLACGVGAFVIGVVAASATPETVTTGAPAYAAPMPIQAPTTWAPTHHVPDEALPAYEVPVPGTPVAMLDPELPVMVLEHRGDWAHVRAVNGWEGWVDARRLVSAAPAASAPGIPPMPVG